MWRFQEIQIMVSLGFVFALNGRFHHADEGFFIHHESHDRAINFGDFPDDARVGDDIQSLAQAFLKLLGFLLSLDLRPNEKEVKYNENE